MGGVKKNGAFLSDAKPQGDDAAKHSHLQSFQSKWLIVCSCSGAARGQTEDMYNMGPSTSARHLERMTARVCFL